MRFALLFACCQAQLLGEEIKKIQSNWGDPQHALIWKWGWLPTRSRIDDPIYIYAWVSRWEPSRENCDKPKWVVCLVNCTVEGSISNRLKSRNLY